MIDLNPNHLETVRRILAEHVPECEVRAFGSRVTWTAKDYSDLDLAVVGERALDFDTLRRLKEAFEESDLPFRVDVLDWHTISPAFQKVIEREYEVVQRSKKHSLGAASEWTELPFSEAVLVNPPVRLERGKRYPFVDMGAVDPGSRWAFATEEREFAGGGSRFQNGDTLMARITPCLENGKIARFSAPEGSAVGHGSTEFIVVRGRPGVTDTDFAYYLTRSEEVRQYAVGQMTGTSGRQRVPTDCLDHLTVRVPRLPEQRAIAHILGTLDDKIELNRRMSETLEAMARALFKSWFVDFDPVRAKMEGRSQSGQSLAGLPGRGGFETRPYADLFPDSFEDSELGEIPKGWKVGTVGDDFVVTMGQSPPGETYNEMGEGLPFFQGRADFGFRYPRHRVFCTAPTRLASPGDTLVSVRAPVGDINMAADRCCIGRGVAAIRHKTGSRSYTYYFARSLIETFRRFEAEGTVFGSIGKDDFRGIKVIIPPAELVQEFERTTFPIDQAIDSNERQSRTLAALRDALLPKLISGELRVKDAERFLKERGL